MRYLLDTNIVIFALKSGKPAQVITFIGTAKELPCQRHWRAIAFHHEQDQPA